MSVLKNHKPSLLLIVLLALTPISLLAQQSNSRLAFGYYNDQEWEKAAPLFLEMYSASQAKPYLTYYVRCLIELKEYNEAKQEIKKAIRRTHNISLNIDLAYIYELTNEDKKAADYIERPFKKFPSSLSAIKVLGNNYISYGKYDHALRVYEIGRAVLNQPDEFHLDMANIYSLQRRHSEMIDEYFALLLTQPRYLHSVQNQLQSALTHDIDKVILKLTRQKSLDYIQQFPGLNIFSEMLIWVLLQEGDYEQAVTQSIALETRSNEVSMRMIDLARSARAAGAFKPALKAYGYVIDKGPNSPDNHGNVSLRPSQTPYNLALTESAQTLLQELERSGQTKESKYQTLIEVYSETLHKIQNQKQTAVLLKDMAYINTYYLHNFDQALSQIDSALSISDSDPQFITNCLLAKGNTLLISGDPWEATFIFARVEKENAQNPSGSLAKYMKAQLAYFTGDFKWALAQLDVLKGSTSKLIANDAFELALLIRENISPSDSLNHGLTQLSHAEYLFFQKRIDEGFVILDSLINGNPSLPVVDDALFKKADLLCKKNNPEQAKPLFLEIINNYKDDMWGHKALFNLGEIFYDQKNWEQALQYFEELVSKFPNSFYQINARKRIREIHKLTRSDNQTQ
ncbi:MAG: tetratricopeptide repeat protein [Bacteroidales bacterium]|nr:tetratricopeptide repeat protein [Bacteroidales bacterium]